MVNRSGTSRWTSFGQCNKKVKSERPVRTNDGIVVKMLVCGMHASVYDRAMEKQKNYEAERNASDVAQERAQAFCERLKGFGVEATPYYSTFTRQYTGEVILNPERVEPETIVNALNKFLGEGI